MRSRTRPAPLADGAPRSSRHPWRSLLRAASWHRRPLAVLAAVATVLSGLAATVPPGPPTTTVVRTRVALAAGTLLGPEHVETVPMARSAVPDQALDAEAVAGQRLAGPVSARQVLTAPSLLSERSLRPPGRVLAPVRVADAEVVALLRPGEEVDVLAAETQTGRSSTVAAGARVVAVPPPTEEQRGAGALVMLEVDRSSVPGLARALSTSTLTVIWS